jgi:hypothetical protein
MVLCVYVCALCVTILCYIGLSAHKNPNEDHIFKGPHTGQLLEIFLESVSQDFMV